MYRVDIDMALFKIFTFNKSHLFVTSTSIPHPLYQRTLLIKSSGSAAVFYVRFMIIGFGIKKISVVNNFLERLYLDFKKCPLLEVVYTQLCHVDLPSCI